MRIASDARKIVFFLGFADADKFTSVGTGFFVTYDDCQYFVTAKHVALPLGDAPFAIRLNRIDGGSNNIHVDVGDIRWFPHPDPDVDLVVVPFNDSLKADGYDVRYLGGLENMENAPEDYDCGDFCYTIGLFQLLAGKKRNLPVVHSGNIALLPDADERIPVQSWEKEGAEKQVEGYLVQSESIQGLSGAPVFARGHIEFDLPMIKIGRDVGSYLPLRDVGFLGVWQGAWDAKADAVRMASIGRDVRVPVGMGIVIPARKLVDLLESEDVKNDRQEIKRKQEGDRSASLDSVTIGPLSNDANPSHREDFTRLVGAAAQKPKQDD